MPSKEYIISFFYSNGIAVADETDEAKIKKMFPEKPDYIGGYIPIHGIHREGHYVILLTVFLEKAPDGLPKQRGADHIVTCVIVQDHESYKYFEPIKTSMEFLKGFYDKRGSTIVELVAHAQDMYSHLYDSLKIQIILDSSKPGPAQDYMS